MLAFDHGFHWTTYLSEKGIAALADGPPNYGFKLARRLAALASRR